MAVGRWCATAAGAALSASVTAVDPSACLVTVELRPEGSGEDPAAVVINFFDTQLVWIFFADLLRAWLCCHHPAGTCCGRSLRLTPPRRQGLFTDDGRIDALNNDANKYCFGSTSQRSVEDLLTFAAGKVRELLTGATSGSRFEFRRRACHLLHRSSAVVVCSRWASPCVVASIQNTNGVSDDVFGRDCRLWRRR